MRTKLHAHLYCTVCVTALALCVCSAGIAEAQSKSSKDEQIETVVVTGQRAALQSAVTIKQNADVVVDSVASEDVGKLPDNSITEVLQRLPGVNITRLQVGGSSENYYGEGTGISIRGLTSTVSLLNGRDSFSAANGRNLAWEDIPPELAQGIDVFKSLSATMPEGGFGGVVNLRTRQPFDFDGLTASLTATGNYADLSKKGHVGGVGMISDRWNTSIGEFGLLFNITYSDLETRADGVQVNPYFPTVYNMAYTNSVTTSLPSLSDTGSKEVYVPAGFGFNSRTDNRVRIGYYLAAQWRPSDNLLLGLTAFQSRYTMNDTNRSMYLGSGVQSSFAPNSKNSFDSDGNLTQTSGLDYYTYGQAAAGLNAKNSWAYQPLPESVSTSYQHDVNSTTDITFTADWQPNDKLSTNFALQYIDSTATSQYNSAAFWLFINGLGLSLSPYGSSATPKITLSSDSIDLTNANNYGWLSTMPHKMHNYGREGAFYSDTVYTVSDAGLLRKIHGGLKVTYRNERDNETNWKYKQLAPYWGTTYDYASKDTSEAEQVDLSDLFGGSVGIPSKMWFPAVDAIKDPIKLQKEYCETSSEVLCNTSNVAATFSKGTLAKLSESVATGYVMADFAMDDLEIPFSGNAGFRVVAYRDHASGYRWTPEIDEQSLENSSTTTCNGTIITGCQPKINTSAEPAIAVNGGHSQIDILPSLNIQTQLTPELKARFAFSQAVNRPTFAQMNPRGYISGTYTGNYIGYFGSNWGDPNLKPEKAEQLDVSLEYYFTSGGLIHFSGFWKNIHNYISTAQQSENVSFAASLGSLTDPSLWEGGDVSNSTLCKGTNAAMTCTVAVSVTKYFNEKKAARIDGFEIGVQKYATFLPAPFDGFGVDFNYTYIDSSQPGALAYDMMGNAITGMPVTGLSKNTINIAAMFDKGPLSLRLAYNWRSDFLSSTAAWQTAGQYSYTNNLNYSGQQGVVTRYSLPVYQYGAGQLDANMSYNLTDDISWTLEASNLTRTQTRLYMMEGTTSSGTKRLYNRSWYQADTRYTTQLRFKF